MVLKIRLARFGVAHKPFYNIVVAHARKPPKSLPLEVLGTYDPIPKTDSTLNPGKPYKDIRIDISRARYWLGVGAQPSDTVERLLAMVGVLERKPLPGRAAVGRGETQKEMGKGEEGEVLKE